MHWLLLVRDEHSEDKVSMLDPSQLQRLHENLLQNQAGAHFTPRMTHDRRTDARSSPQSFWRTTLQDDSG